MEEFLTSEHTPQSIRDFAVKKAASLLGRTETEMLLSNAVLVLPHFNVSVDDILSEWSKLE